MNEKGFTDIIYNELSNNSLIKNSYEVLKYENLLYKLIINDKGELQPEDYIKPTRGKYAFQTDIVIKKIIPADPAVAVQEGVNGLELHVGERGLQQCAGGIRCVNDGVYIPLVVIEIKYGGLTTHDVLTYSAKALKHKDIYPYLRYGLVLGGLKSIPNRFFVHNQGFDFALALEIDNEKLLNQDSGLLNNVIVEQLKASEMLLKPIGKNNKNPKQFMSKLEIK
jgi:hypothetical protein